MFPFDLWHRGRTRPALTVLFVEAFLVTLIATGMAWLVFAAASGLIAVFLVSLSLQDSFSTLLEVNRRDIYEGRLAPYSANAWLVFALVAVFAGCCLAFSAVAWWLPTSSLRLVFASQLELSPVHALDLSRLTLGQFEALFLRNLSVFGLCLLVSAVFRSGGALMILAWNASVWAVSYALLSRSTIVVGGAPVATTLLAAAGGITPHLVLEAAAYITAALVGIFVAKAVEKYRFSDARFRRVMRASLLLVLAGGVLLAIGAAAESWWPPVWFAWVL